MGKYTQYLNTHGIISISVKQVIDKLLSGEQRID